MRAVYSLETGSGQAAAARQLAESLSILPLPEDYALQVNTVPVFSDPDPRVDPHDDFARIRICIKINADPKHWMVPHNSTKYGRRNAYIRKTAKQIVKNANMSELI